MASLPVPKAPFLSVVVILAGRACKNDHHRHFESGKGAHVQTVKDSVLMYTPLLQKSLHWDIIERVLSQLFDR